MQKTSCKNGHPYPEHAYVRSNGKRFCRTCPSERRAAKRRMTTKYPERYLPTEERFWLFVDKTPGQGSEGECWEWQRYRDPNGYGQIGVGDVVELTHRYTSTLVDGPIPEGIIVCHKCDNPPCCRPSHLFRGTHGDNAADKISKGRGPDMKEVSLYRRNPVGERNGRAKLTETQTRQILSDSVNGDFQSLAHQFDVSWATIYSIARRKTWKHL